MGSVNNLANLAKVANIDGGEDVNQKEVNGPDNKVVNVAQGILNQPLGNIVGNAPHNQPVANQPVSNFDASAKNIDWNSVTQSKKMDSNNPVFCMTGANGKNLYVKFVPEAVAERSNFADWVLHDVGFEVADSKTLPLYGPDGKTCTPDAAKIISAINQNRAQNSQEFKPEYAMLDVKNIIVTNEVPGKPIGKFLEEKDNQGRIDVFKNPLFQADLGKLIGADAFLGNFDRVSYSTNKTVFGAPEPGKFHGSNFMVDPQTNRIRVLDNDIVQPGEDLLNGGGLNRMLKGGELKNDLTISDRNYPSLDKLASPSECGTAVKEALRQLKFSGKVDFSEQDLDSISAAVAPHVTSTIDLLSKSVKDDLIGTGPLGDRFKEVANSMHNKTGFDHDAFKIRAKYAGLVANQQNGSDGIAQRYADYREWKGDLKDVKFDTTLPKNAPMEPKKMNPVRVLARKVTGLMDSDIKNGRTARNVAMNPNTSHQDLRKIVDNPKLRNDRSGERAVYEATRKTISTQLDSHIKTVTDGLTFIENNPHVESKDNYKKALKKSLPEIDKAISNYNQYGYEMSKNKGIPGPEIDALTDKVLQLADLRTRIQKL